MLRIRLLKPDVSCRLRRYGNLWPSLTGNLLLCFCRSTFPAAMSTATPVYCQPVIGTVSSTSTFPHLPPYGGKQDLAVVPAPS